MNTDNWQANCAFLHEQLLIELKRLWVREKSDLQTLCNQIEQQINQAERLQITINGPKGSGKSHLLHLLLKHLADCYLPSTKQANSTPIKLIFIDQNSAQINHYIELLHAILVQCINTPDKEIETTENGLENAILAQLNISPIAIFIEQYDQILTGIGSAATKSFQKLLTASTNSENSMLLVTTEMKSTPQRVNNSHAKNINLQPLTSAQTQQLIELLLQNAEQQKKAELKLCSAMLYHIFVGNGHYYHGFINTIGTPILEKLSDQISHFIAQQSQLTYTNIALLAPQQRQIVTLLSKQVIKHLGAMSVNTIANQLQMTHQTTSSQLKKLKDNALSLIHI